MENAISLLHHVVQDHGDEHTILRRGLDGAPFTFFSEKLGWAWPREYRTLLEKCDGFIVGNAELYSFHRSFEIYLLLREGIEPQALWPIGSDGCGNYYAVSLNAQPAVVAFLDAAEEYQPGEENLPSLAEWLVEQLTEVCAESGCARPA